jgi:hypothetical protein
VGLVVVLDALNFLWIWTYAPYVLLAQSRAEMGTSLCSMVVYITALLPVTNLISSTTAASIMVPVQFLSLLNNIFTQMFPMVSKAVEAIGILSTVLVFGKTEYDMGEVVFLLCEETSSPFIHVEESCIQRTSLMLCGGPYTPRQMLFADEATNGGDDIASKIGDEGVIIGCCDKNLYPDDYDARMLVKLRKNNKVLAVLTRDLSRDYMQAMQAAEVYDVHLGKSSLSASNKIVDESSNKTQKLQEIEMMSPSPSLKSTARQPHSNKGLVKGIGSAI